jgi:hypothetical protein
LEQSGHLYGFSPVWIVTCEATLPACFDLYPHTPQKASCVHVSVDVPFQMNGDRHSVTV